MPDITTVWDPANSRGDWAVAGAALRSGDDLVTAVLLSLFTDRTADPDDVIPDGTDNPRGWWGDLGQAYPIGSKIWLRLRAKQTDETLRQVEDDIRAALAWMIADGVAARIEAGCEWTRPGMLGALVTIHRNDGASTSVRFSRAWTSVA